MTAHAPISGRKAARSNDRAPIICRTFDCRRFVQINFHNRADRRAAASQSEVVRAGIERMKTL
jgi:hypothetical protein